MKNPGDPLEPLCQWGSGSSGGESSKGLEPGADSARFCASRAPSVGAARRWIEKVAGHWGWYLTVRARK